MTILEIITFRENLIVNIKKYHQLKKDLATMKKVEGIAECEAEDETGAYFRIDRILNDRLYAVLSSVTAELEEGIAAQKRFVEDKLETYRKLCKEHQLTNDITSIDQTFDEENDA